MYYLCFLFISLSSILYLYRYIKDSTFKKIRFFILYLIFTVLVELVVSFALNKGVDNTNYIYNIYSLIEFNLLFMFYYEVSNDKITKRTIIGSITLFNVTCFTWYLFHNFSFYHFNSFVIVLGAFLMAIILFLSLREILLSDKIVNYKTDIIFWITTGLLLYYLGSIPLMGIYSFMEKGVAFFQIHNIQFVVTILLHSCVIIGLLWSWKKVE